MRARAREGVVVKVRKGGWVRVERRSVYRRLWANIVVVNVVMLPVMVWKGWRDIGEIVLTVRSSGWREVPEIRGPRGARLSALVTQSINTCPTNPGFSKTE